MVTYNFPTQVRGDSFGPINFTITVNASPLDLTGALIRADFRVQGYRYLRLSTNPGAEDGTITITDATAGKFSIIQQIIDIPKHEYDYDIEILLASGVRKTYIGGTWTVQEDITHDR